VTAGDLLGLIQQKDPTGNRARWFVDNGCAQGFVDAAILRDRSSLKLIVFYYY
jgi:hypothetical protein